MRESPVPPDWEAVDAAPGGVAQASYAGRPNVLGRINPGSSPSLLLASIVSGARVLARVLAGFFAAGAGEGSVR